MNIQKELKQRFPELVGEIKIQAMNRTTLVSGNVFVSDSELFKSALNALLLEKFPMNMVANSLKVNEFVVVEKEVNTNKEHEKVLDEVNILYNGYLSVNHITPNKKFKVLHENNRDKLDNIIKVLNFISPIVLDSNLKVIDGDYRLQLAKDNNIKEVPVIVLDDCGKRADFLRLALNRTAEFQRWNYREVDDYVDETPQAQPILEPIGFFGRYVLPTSFFSDTVIQYVIDPFNEKQKQYSQEEGLAEWAKYRREQMAKLSAEKRTKKPKKTENVVSLFDLAPKKEDFLETYEIEEEMEEFIDKYKEIAGRITDEQDAIKKAEIEEKGGVWQNTHRTSKEVAEDNRLLAIEKIEASDILTEEEKLEVITNIDDYTEYLTDMEILAKVLRGEE